MTGKSISPSAISVAIRMAQEQGTASERAAVVKWLRNLTPEQIGWQWFGDLDDEAMNTITDAIERGEHHTTNAGE